MRLNEIIEKIVDFANLGSLKKEPVRVSGGFMHKMFKIETEKGVFALKLLNPEIMKRETALRNFTNADELEEILQNHGIELLGAEKINGRKLNRLNDQYFYLFKWFEGKSLKDGEINIEHCLKMSDALFKIHGLEKRDSEEDFEKSNIDWGFYLELSKQRNNRIYEKLASSLKILKESENYRNDNMYKFPKISAICHNDMDPKNVLWHGYDYKIIDNECLGFSNPYQEMFNLALCWSGYESCQLNFNLFSIFIKNYFKKDKINMDFETLYYSKCGCFGWLEYNLKRALGLENCDEEEKKLGEGQVFESIEHAVYYASLKNEILSFLKTL